MGWLANFLGNTAEALWRKAKDSQAPWLKWMQRDTDPGFRREVRLPLVVHLCGADTLAEINPNHEPCGCSWVEGGEYHMAVMAAPLPNGRMGLDCYGAGHELHHLVMRADGWDSWGVDPDHMGEGL